MPGFAFGLGMMRVYRSMDGLSSAELKRQRAGEHLESLQAEFYPFRERQRDVIGHQFDADAGCQVLKVVREPDRIPERWSLIVADALGNLRSVLDHLVSGLDNNGGIDSAFVVAADEGDFRRRARRLKGVPDQVRTIVETEQPYKRGNPPGSLPLKTSRLWLLDRLNNIEKHRYLSLFATVPIGGAGGHFPDMSTLYYGQPLVPETIIAKFPNLGPDVHVDHDVLLEIVFDDGPAHRLGAPMLIRGLLQDTARIIERFRPLYG